MKTITIHPEHPTYPAGMRELLDRDRALVAALESPALRLRGRWPERHGIAIVGTREATDTALSFARTLASDLVAEGYSVWSGGAVGIDAAAHEATLDAGGETVIVAPGGADFPYPTDHAELFERVLQHSGAVLSLWPDGTAPHYWRFLQRNQVLAALTIATVVVQAPHRSGARSTARAARKLGRPVFVVPHTPWHKRGAGCAVELTLGARAACSGPQIAAQIRQGRLRLADPGSTAPQIGTENPPGAPPAGPDYPNRKQELGTDERALLEALGSAPLHLDQICTVTGRALPAVARGLLTLTLRGVVVEGPAGHYRRLPT